MVYTMNEAQLLGLWTATRLLGEIRRVEDPMAQAEFLTKVPDTLDCVHRRVGTAHLRSD